MKLTIDDIKKLNPCYGDDRLREVFTGRDYLTHEDIPALTIPGEDIMWVLSHYLPDPKAFARRVASDAAHLSLVRTWLETDYESLRAAARSAAQATEQAAAQVAARAAAGACAWASAWNAAYAAAWTKYINWAIEEIEAIEIEPNDEAIISEDGSFQTED